MWGERGWGRRVWQCRVALWLQQSWAGCDIQNPLQVLGTATGDCFPGCRGWAGSASTWSAARSWSGVPRVAGASGSGGASPGCSLAPGDLQLGDSQGGG